MTDNTQNKIELPKLRIGFILAGLAIVLSSTGVAIQNRLLVIAGIAFLFTAVIYWFTCVYRIHQYLMAITDHEYSITPKQAIGYYFIPGYNFYWIFRWPMEIIRFVNHMTQSSLKTWVPGLVFLIAIPFGRVLGLGLLINFSVLAYLKKNIESATRKAEKIPIPEWQYTKERFKGPSKNLILALVLLFIVLPLIAAIVIPNFITVRNEARLKADQTALATRSNVS